MEEIRKLGVEKEGGLGQRRRIGREEGSGGNKGVDEEGRSVWRRWK